MENYNEQENFWASKFGNDYIERNSGIHMVDSNENMFREVFKGFPTPASVLEIGANIGLNLEALCSLFPDLSFSAVEINEKAATIMREKGFIEEIFVGSFLDVEISREYDLIFSKGVLIHMNPIDLPKAYEKMAVLAKKHILIAEYYNPYPVTIEYRGHTNKLFKRDFAGEFLDAHPEFTVVKTGFAYHRAQHPQDDLTWFLLERRNYG